VRREIINVKFTAWRLVVQGRAPAALDIGLLRLGPASLAARARARAHRFLPCAVQRLRLICSSPHIGVVFLHEHARTILTAVRALRMLAMTIISTVASKLVTLNALDRWWGIVFTIVINGCSASVHKFGYFTTVFIFETSVSRFRLSSCVVNSAFPSGLSAFFRLLFAHRLEQFGNLDGICCRGSGALLKPAPIHIPFVVSVALGLLVNANHVLADGLVKSRLLIQSVAKHTVVALPRVCISSGTLETFADVTLALAAIHANFVWRNIVTRIGATLRIQI
jgi:hypothetical protein